MRPPPARQDEQCGKRYRQRAQPSCDKHGDRAAQTDEQGGDDTPVFVRRIKLPPRLGFP